MLDQESTIGRTGRSPVFFDQPDDLLQDQISFRGGRPDRERLCNKFVYVLVNTIPAARSVMRSNNLESGIISNSIHWTYLFTVNYTYLNDVPPAGMAGSLMMWDGHIYLELVA